MEKITLKALELAGFKNADSIAKIISYVPNPQVAVEMLLGVYTPMELNKEERFKQYRYQRNELAEIISIDELGNTITFLVHQQKTKQVWYLSEEDKKNNIYIEDRPSKYYDYSHIPTTGCITREQTRSISDFNSDWCNPLSVEEAFKLLNSWDNYLIPIAGGLESTEVIDLPF